MKRSGKWNSLFRRKNSLFPAKNSLFRPSQGIGLQRIEIANRFPIFAHAQGIMVQAFDLSDRLDTKNARKGRIRKNSLLNSLFSGNLRIKADPLDTVRFGRPPAIKNRALLPGLGMFFTGR
jgi:hypothetical protein